MLNMKKRDLTLLIVGFSVLTTTLLGFMSGVDEVQTKEELGRKLFFDNILSKDNTIIVHHAISLILPLLIPQRLV